MRLSITSPWLSIMPPHCFWHPAPLLLCHTRPKVTAPPARAPCVLQPAPGGLLGSWATHPRFACSHILGDASSGSRPTAGDVPATFNPKPVPCWESLPWGPVFPHPMYFRIPQPALLLGPKCCRAQPCSDTRHMGTAAGARPLAMEMCRDCLGCATASPGWARSRELQGRRRNVTVTKLFGLVCFHLFVHPRCTGTGGSHLKASSKQRSAFGLVGADRDCVRGDV